MELWQLLLLVLGGALCGVINALSGGGSFITLPLLLWFGLPPQIANASNRVAILLQSAAGVGEYHRHRVMPWRQVPGLAAVSIAGSLLGAYAAARIEEGLFRHLAALLFAVMAATIFVDPKRWTRAESAGRVTPALYPIFLVIGVYGGFLQAGAGVLQLGALVLLGGFDVVRANALKFGLATCFTAAALLVFWRAGQVLWLPGLALAAGSTVGGVLGARLVIAKGARWVRVFVVLAALAAIIKLLMGD